MYIDDFTGEEIITTESDLSKKIYSRPAFNSNYFILTFSDSGFPQLSIFVKENYGVVYYMNNSETFVSINEKNDSKQETEIFYENSTGASVELSTGNILKLDKILEAAMAFYKQGSRPDAINWQEL